jgi:putative acetyltransferase
LLVIRPETAADQEAVFRVETDAFAPEDVASLVDLLRAHGKLSLSLVAELDGAVVGHVSFSPVTFDPPREDLQALQLAPLAVLPAHQRQGIGGALVREGLARCRALGFEAIFLLGHPAYYPRFGFRPAREFGAHYEDDRDAFMAIELRPGALRDLNATLVLAEEFDAYT